MSLSQALAISLSGLRTTQAGLSLVAGNVANAQTPGYVRKSLSLETTVAGGIGGGVRIATVNRVIDEYVQRQLRVETSGGAYAALRAEFYQRIQQLYGEPGSASSLESVFNNFTTSMQALVTSPESAAARSMALSSAQVLTQYFNGLTADIQALREDAENGLADAVANANNAIQKIADINAQLAHSPAANATTAALKDQRDMYVEQLSTLMDIRVVTGEHNQYNVFTNSGIQLVGIQPSRLAFDGQGTITPTSQWSANPAESTLGTLTLLSPNGGAIDLFANKAIRSGKIAALVEMRDHILVEAQNQLDAMAVAMAQALSDETVAGAAVTAGAQTGFEVDTADLLPGNTINFTFFDHQTKRERHVTIIRVDDASALPLDNSITADPNDEVVGVDFAGGMAGVLAQLNAHFNGVVDFTGSGTTLQVLDDGATGRSDVTALSKTRTVTGLSEGGLALPFFTDATDPYSGFITSNRLQSVGIAGRIAVNPDLRADPSRLVLFGAGVSVGDPQRPEYLYERLTSAKFTFPPNTGLGTAGMPYDSDIATYLRQVLGLQGEAASNAVSLSQGQTVVVNSLKQRIADEAGVNVDQEMAYLINLQTSYAANARVMSVVKEMIDTLLRM